MPILLPAATLGAGALAGLLLVLFAGSWSHVDLALHSAMEALGGSAGVMLAFFLLDDAVLCGVPSFPLAAGFLAMGVLDLFHSTMPPTSGFVMVHSASGLLGGLFCLGLYVPAMKTSTPRRMIAWATSASAALIAAAAWGASVLPVFSDGGRTFTPPAVWSNALAGASFLAVTARLAWESGRPRCVECVLFACVTACLATAYLLFPFCRLWDAVWWLRHALRLSAFLAIDVYLVLRLRESARQMRAANLDLEQRVAAKTAKLKLFVAKLAHDFAAPLTSIRGYTETLLKSRADSPELRVEFLQIIERNAVRLAEAVDEVATLSALDPSRKRPSPETIDLAAFMREFSRSIAPFALRRSVSIELRLPPGLIVSISRSELLHIVQNLCVNAIKYNRPHGRVEVSGDRVEDLLTVRFRDTGVGIPEADLPRVFDPFFRSPRHRDLAEGSGLGLSIVKETLEANGGTIQVESRPGEGSTFAFTLPLASRVQNSASAPDGCPTGAAARSAGGAGARGGPPPSVSPPRSAGR